MHVERWGNDEVTGIEKGTCYIFPKLDGTNGSVWLSEQSTIAAGSRNRQLSNEEDNVGFFSFIKNNEKYLGFFNKHKKLRLYGEWLVPHTIRNYEQSAWRKFYVFDVFDDDLEQYLSYDTYKPLLDEFDIPSIPLLCQMENPRYEQLLDCLEKNNFLLTDGAGEGIVVKNYNFNNCFNNTVWAKFISSDFKASKGVKPEKTIEMVEIAICEQYITEHFVNKVYQKIQNEAGGWSSKFISRLFQTVYYDLVNEELWNFIKKMKNPTINFKTLQYFVTTKVKELKPELF